MEAFNHIPVLAEAVLKYLDFPEDRPVRMIDGTIGGGGHSGLFLKKYPNLELLGIDRDIDALTASAEHLAFAKDRVCLRQGNYSDFPRFMHELSWNKVDGILLDIGVSSPQLDRAERGFAWRLDGPLDMRMDQRSVMTAGRLLNTASQEDLIRIFRDYGEIREARRLATVICEVRKEHPFGVTGDLVKVAEQVLHKGRFGAPPVATLVFQALRIAVNDELGELKRALHSSCCGLAENGKIAVISFHSLEDRIVKNFFRRESMNCICPPGLPVCMCGHHAAFELVTHKPVVADETELMKNRRAGCAKLRVAKRI